MARFYRSFGLLAAVVLMALATTGVTAKDTSGDFQSSYNRFMAMHAMNYTYRALIAISGEPPMSGVVDQVYNSHQRGPTTPVSGSSSVGDYTLPIETMFDRIRDGSGRSSAGYDPVYGFPLRFEVLGTLFYTVSISEFTKLATDEQRDALTATKNAALEKWRAAKYVQYHYYYVESCDGTCTDPDPDDPSRTRPLIVDVLANSIAVTNSTTQEAVPLLRPTIDDMFGPIQSAIDGTDLAYLDVEYHDTLGYPVRFTQRSYFTGRTHTIYVTSLAKEAYVKSRSWVFGVVAGSIVLAVVIVLLALAIRVHRKVSNSKGWQRPTNREIREQRRVLKEKGDTPTDIASGSRAAAVRIAYEAVPEPHRGPADADNAAEFEMREADEAFAAHPAAANGRDDDEDSSAFRTSRRVASPVRSDGTQRAAFVV